MEKIRKELLEETNYRCGSCMRNITPRVYYLDDSPDKNPIHDYVIYNYEKQAYYDTEEQKFYNISDRCHIIPNAEVKDEYNDFYNLIALCKICHHEVDKAKMLDITELKRLKLHWLIASGRFTKIEFDCLFDLYKEKPYPWTKYFVIPNDENILKIANKLNIIAGIQNSDNVENIQNLAYFKYGIQYNPQRLLNQFLIFDLNNQGIIAALSEIGLTKQDVEVMREKNKNFVISLPDKRNFIFFRNIIENKLVNQITFGETVLYITDKGKQFCKKFENIDTK